MKKTMLILITGYVCICLFLLRGKAQGSNNVIAFTDTKAFLKSLRTVNAYAYELADSNLSTTSANAINLKAIKNFKKRYNQVADAKWYKISDGFISCFKLDNVQSKIFYSKKGEWQFSLKTYGEDKLPRDVRTQVKSIYFDYAITQIDEVESVDNLVYIIHLEDKTSFKKVRVFKNGDMDVMEEFTKS